MTDEDRLEILGRALDLGLFGMGGECAETAIAINELLFNNKGQLVAAVNWPLWQRGYLVGHVGVRVKGVVWDLEGTYDDEEALQDFLAWGMIDPDDPDYADFGFTEEEAYDAQIVKVSKQQLRQQLPFCGKINPWTILSQAIEDWRS